jgi:hypothetical protein
VKIFEKNFDENKKKEQKLHFMAFVDKNKQNKTILSTEMTHALIDADGSINTSIDKKTNKDGTFYVNVTWSVAFAQTEINVGNSEAIANFINRQVRAKKRFTGPTAGTDEPTTSATLLSDSGQVIVEMYRNNPPRSRRRLKQFIAFEYCIANLDASSVSDPREKAKRIVRELFVVKHISSEQKQNIGDLFEQMKAKTPYVDEIFDEASALAFEDIAVVDEKIERIWRDVPNQTYTKEHILGAFASDGSMYVGYVLRKQKNGGVTLGFKPAFSVANEDKEPLIALKNSIGYGNVASAGKNGYQYVLSGTETLNKIVRPIFENVQIPSAYKQRQVDIVFDVVDKLLAKKHRTFEGFCEIIDLSYNVKSPSSTNCRRKYSQEEFKQRKFFSKRYNKM